MDDSGNCYRLSGAGTGDSGGTVQRYDAAGVPLGSEFVIRIPLAISSLRTLIDGSGNFVVAWQSGVRTAAATAFMQRYAPVLAVASFQGLVWKTWMATTFDAAESGYLTVRLYNLPVDHQHHYRPEGWYGFRYLLAKTCLLRSFSRQEELSSSPIRGWKAILQRWDVVTGL